MIDFFLSSSDERELNARPRSVTILVRVEPDDGPTRLRVRVAPPLPGSHYRSQQTEITEVLLAPRFAGDMLDTPDNIQSWPVSVYVLLEGAEREPRILAWGELYKTEQDAADAYYPPLQRE